MTISTDYHDDCTTPFYFGRTPASGSGDDTGVEIAGPGYPGGGFQSFAHEASKAKRRTRK